MALGGLPDDGAAADGHHDRAATSRPHRFLQLADVAEILDVSMSQVLALVRAEDLRGIKIGGRGHWRVEDTELEAYIQRCYRETSEQLRSQRLGTAPAD